MNPLTKSIKTLDKVAVFSRWINVIAVISVFAMVLITFTDVIARYVFNHPIVGALSVTELFLLVAVYTSIANVWAQKGHISVDVITSMLTTTARMVMEFITTVIGIGLMIIIIWQTFVHALGQLIDHDAHGLTIQVPAGPFPG